MLFTIDCKRLYLLWWCDFWKGCYGGIEAEGFKLEGIVRYDYGYSLGV